MSIRCFRAVFAEIVAVEEGLGDDVDVGLEREGLVGHLCAVLEDNGVVCGVVGIAAAFPAKFDGIGGGSVFNEVGGGVDW